jgi:hypothetical protein
MNLYALLIYDQSYQLQHSTYNWEQFNFSEKIQIGLGGAETIASNLIKRSKLDQYYNIVDKFGDREIAIWASSFGGYQIIITDLKYPKRIALQFLKTLHTSKQTESQLAELFKTYSCPPAIDKMTQIKDEMEDTQVIMLNDIELLLSRQESIDDLLIKSGTMVDTSNSFVIKTKRLNSCCIII